MRATLSHNIAAYAAGAIDPVVAVPGVAIDHCDQNLVMSDVGVRITVRPDAKARTGDVQRVAQPCHQPDCPGLRDQGDGSGLNV